MRSRKISIIYESCLNLWKLTRRKLYAKYRNYNFVNRREMICFAFAYRRKHAFYSRVSYRRCYMLGILPYFMDMDEYAPEPNPSLRKISLVTCKTGNASGSWYYMQLQANLYQQRHSKTFWKYSHRKTLSNLCFLV